jgi:hypothetical protein
VSAWDLWSRPETVVLSLQLVHLLSGLLRNQVAHLRHGTSWGTDIWLALGGL